MAEPEALVLLAQSCEELEAVTCIDLLRRAGISVTTAGLDDRPVLASRKVTLVPDTSLDRVLSKDFDAVILPGGLPGADILEDDQRIVDLVKRTHDAGRIVAAICAAPSVLLRAGVLAGRRVTCYPGRLEDRALNDVTVTGSAVERDGNVVTSRGPGTAMDFALTLVEMLTDASIRDKVEAGLVRD